MKCPMCGHEMVYTWRLGLKDGKQVRIWYYHCPNCGYTT